MSEVTRRVFQYILYILEAIEELRELNPEGVNEFRTHSGKLSSRHIKAGDFHSILRKIESKGIAQFHEGLGNTAMGWGTNPLTIKIISWEEFDKYYEEVKCKLDNERNTIR